jgi:hypothetical protein
MIDPRVAKMLIALAALLTIQLPDAQVPASERGQAPQPSIATITAAWARRQAALKTIRITWHADRRAPGFFAMINALNSSRPSRHRIPQPGRKGPSTPTDLILTLHSQSVLCLAHDRLACTIDTEGIDKLCGPEAEFRIPSHVQMILRGGTLRTYSDSRASPKVGDAQTASITSHNARGSFEMGLPEISPIVLALRPETSTVAASHPAAYRISPIRGRVGADTCLIIEPSVDERSGKAAPRTSFWVDPARDYVIVRSVIESKGRCQRQTDITYDRKPGGEWMPITWSIILLDRDGGLDQEFRSTRDGVSAGASLPPSTFELDRADSLLAESNRTRAELGELSQRERASAGSHKRPGPSFIAVTNAALAVFITGGYLASKYKGRLVRH